MTRPEIEALSRSTRSRVLLLVVLLLGGLAAALWSLTRETGIGADEDRRRVMIVTRSDEIDYHAVFEPAGFAIAIDSYDDWLAEARTAGPDSEAEGVALLLELADLRGFALVVFERPSELELGELELEPPIAAIERFDERDYAAASVGDFAFPHRLTVDDPGDDPLLRLPGYGALQAVFRQELISAREDPERPTVEELQFEESTSLGRQMFERPAGFAAIVESTRASVERQYEDGSAAKPLVPPLTTGTAIPTPDGGILVLHHEVVIFSKNARTLELGPGDRMQVSWLSPEALASGLAGREFELEPCPSLAGGVLPAAELEHIASADDGSAVVIPSSAETMTVWRKTGAGCEWTPIGELDCGPSVELAPGSGSGVAARVERGDDESRVVMYSQPGRGSAEPSDRLDAQVLIEQTGRWFSSPVFIDEHHFAVVSTRIADELDVDREERVYVLDRRRPQVYLSLPTAGLCADGRKLHDVLLLRPASEAGGPELLVVTVGPRGGFELIRVGIAADAWSEFTDATAPEPEAGAEGQVVSLAPEQLEVETVSEVATLYGVGVGSGLVILATADHAELSDLVLLDLDAGVRRPLASGATGHYLPRVVADGRHATLVSLTRVGISAEPYRVPRVLALE